LRREYCFLNFDSIFIVLSLFVSLRIGHSKYVKGKIRSYFMIYDKMCLNDKVVTMAQVDGPKRHIHINFRDNGRMQDMFSSTGGQVVYRHSNCEISAVRIIRATECWCHTMDSLWRVVVLMTQATLITRARCDGVSRRRRPYPHLRLGRI